MSLRMPMRRGRAADSFFEAMAGEATRGRHGSEAWGEAVDEPGLAEADRFFAELVGEPRHGTRRAFAEAFEPGEAGGRHVGGTSLITWVQRGLNRVGAGPIAEDGVVGTQTRAALRRFRQPRGLRDDPRLLTDTLHALAAATGSLPPGVWPGPPPTHRGRSPDLSQPCAEPPTTFARFAFASARPPAEHTGAIAALAQTIVASWSSDDPVHGVCLEGHTDSVGAQQPNVQLGQRRAEAIEARLLAEIDRASPGLSLRVGSWSTTAGETQPLVPNTTSANRARNRRVEVRLNRRWTAGEGAGVSVRLVGPIEAMGRVDGDEADGAPVFTVALGAGIQLVATGRSLPVGMPAYVWTTANPAIAIAIPSAGTQAHPNPVTIRGMSVGRTTATVAYKAASGAISRTVLEIVVAAPPPVPLDLGPLTDAEWADVLRWLTEGETGPLEPLTTVAEDNARQAAARLFCNRNALHLEGEDPLLCVLMDVTRADARVRGMVAHVTARGPIIPWRMVATDDRIRHVMNLLIGTYGYPVNGAAGLVGNLLSESGVLPSRVEGSAIATPMRARDFAGVTQDFTAEQIMNRDRATRTGPARPGIGLAQWTSPGRRAGLFAHPFRGVVLGPRILFDMDAQVDFMVDELGRRFARVDRVLRGAAVTVDAASDEVLYNFEVPRAIMEDGRKLPRADPRVQAVFGRRRAQGARARRVHDDGG